MWDPARYAHFRAERLRPGRELIARLAHPEPRRVVDLGCGTGELTAELARRWPEAEVEGIDQSPAMLAQARARGKRILWREADIAGYRTRTDILFSNAALHWLPEHEQLFPRLVRALNLGGVLAAQMPRNDDSPARQALSEVVSEGPWRERLAPLWQPAPVAPPSFYLDRLVPLCTDLDVWETVYYHRLSGANPAFEWFAGATLRPLLAALDAETRAEFEAACAARIARLYPAAADGRTVFPFRRLFIVARR